MATMQLPTGNKLKKNNNEMCGMQKGRQFKNQAEKITKCCCTRTISHNASHYNGGIYTKDRKEQGAYQTTSAKVRVKLDK